MNPVRPAADGTNLYTHSAKASPIAPSGATHRGWLRLGLLLVTALFLSGYPAFSSASDKWHPGIYVKIEGWQLERHAEMDRIFDELRATPQLRGIKVVIFWGRYEKRDTSTGISTYDFSQIDQILARLSALDNKHLIVSVPWREF